MAKLGFVGVGLMGHGMAANLIKHGHALTVIAHRNRVPVDNLVQLGAIEAPDLVTLAHGQDGIFICVATSEQVEATVNGLLPGLAAGQIVIDTGTTEPAMTMKLQTHLAASGISYVDAPIGGGAQQAEAGDLVSMVGASAADYARVKPWLACYSRTSEHMGTAGTGHRAKLLNNLLSMGQAALIIEAYRLARDTDIDWQKLFTVNMGGAARSSTLERIMPGAIEGDYRRYLFTLENALKDMTYIRAFAEEAGRPSLMAEAAHDFLASNVRTEGPATLLSELLAPGSPHVAKTRL
jgi:3-hydroxyisobutyrate dehydrogenase-like beta-hydroxyacid dehydrogenase